jgi:hypothetical protein
MNVHNKDQPYPNKLSCDIAEYIDAREQRDAPYASKFAARSLAKRFGVTEDAASGAIGYLHKTNVVRIDRTTVHLRTYRLNNK